MFKSIFNLLKPSKLNLDKELYKWLEEKSTDVEKSVTSAYFNINGIKLRYSDHISINSSGSLQIISNSDAFVVMISNYKTPKIFNKSDGLNKVKTFIEDYIFIYKCLYPSKERTFAEIIESKFNKVCPKPHNKSLVDNIRNMKQFVGYKQSLRDKIIYYLRCNPDKYSQIKEYIVKNCALPKSEKLLAWKELISKN